MKLPKRCHFCQNSNFEQIFEYREPPAGEVQFPFSAGTYDRQVYQCQICSHFYSVHNMDTQALYEKEYVNATYGDLAGIHRTFERIIALPPEKSDNIGRVRAIQAFSKHHEVSSQTLLDVGSGLGVFPYQMKKEGWTCLALDPDERAVKHMQEMLDIQAVCGDFMTGQNLEQFDVITFNKVLEHVEDPIVMLTQSAPFLKMGGFIYIELPDGEMATQAGKEREEFFIDHFHIFSAASVTLLAKLAGFCVINMERLQEPSTKYTLRTFLKK